MADVGPLGSTPSPDEAVILTHLRALFEGAEDFADGNVEIAWTDAYSGALSHAQQFPVTDLEAAARFAAVQNRIAGCNLYVGAMLRDPDVLPGARAKDADAYAGRYAWVDLDNGAAVDAAKIATNAVGVKPTLVVTTGTVPSKRMHLWFRLDEWLQPNQMREIVEGIVQNIPGADPAIVNPSRVMRLAGTVTYPAKHKAADGYIVEATTLKVFDRTFSADQIARVYPFDPNRRPGSPQGQTPAPVKGLDIRVGQAGRTDEDLYALLNATRSPGQWYVNMRSAVATLAGRGRTEMEIRLIVGPWCEKGPSDPDLDRMIHDAIQVKGFGAEKRKEEEDEFSRAEEIKEEARSLVATPYQWRDPATISPRQWLYGFEIIRKFVSVYASPGGVGKTALTFAVGAALATGTPLLDTKVHKRSRVWLFNLEDPDDELHRRMAATMIQHRISAGQLRDHLFVDSGRSQRLIVADRKADGSLVATPMVDALVEEIVRRGIDILVVDPVVRSHRADENNNAEMDRVVDIFSEIADRANCAVVLVAHTRKGFEAGSMDSVRGGSALVSGARSVWTVSPMSPEEATKLDIKEEDRRSFIKLDNAKANLSRAPAAARWFRLASVKIGNGNEEYPDGDSVQSIVPWTPPDLLEGLDKSTIGRILDEIVERSKGPFPAIKKDLTALVTRHSPLGAQGAKEIIAKWFKTGLLFDEEASVEQPGGKRVTRRIVYVDASKRPDWG